MSDLAYLKSLLEDATEKFPDITSKRMFGCDGFFAAGNIFALVWKEGRIGLKLPDEKLESELRQKPGAAPWSPGGKMKMASWVLVPDSFHDDIEQLAHWTQQAYSLAQAAGAKKAPAKKTPTKKTQTKKTSAKN